MWHRMGVEGRQMKHPAIQLKVNDSADGPEKSRVDQVLRQPMVIKTTGLSRTTIYRLERCDDFPKRRKLGPRAVGWLASEVEAWISNRRTAH